MTINWIPCSERMPPDDSLIIINVNGNYDKNTGYNMHYLIETQGWSFMRYIEWTPYTEEAWEELSK